MALVSTLVSITLYGIVLHHGEAIMGAQSKSEFNTPSRLELAPRLAVAYLGHIHEPASSPMCTRELGCSENLESKT